MRNYFLDGYSRRVHYSGSLACNFYINQAFCFSVGCSSRCRGRMQQMAQESIRWYSSYNLCAMTKTLKVWSRQKFPSVSWFLWANHVFSLYKFIAIYVGAWSWPTENTACQNVVQRVRNNLACMIIRRVEKTRQAWMWTQHDWRMWSYKSDPLQFDIYPQLWGCPSELYATLCMKKWDTAECLPAGYRVYFGRLKNRQFQIVLSHLQPFKEARKEVWKP